MLPSVFPRVRRLPEPWHFQLHHANRHRGGFLFLQQPSVPIRSCIQIWGRYSHHRHWHRDEGESGSCGDPDWYFFWRTADSWLQLRRRKYESCEKDLSPMVFACLAVALVGCVIFQCSPQSIVNIFGSESDLYNEFAARAFRIFLMMCIPMAYQVSSSVFLQAIGKPMPSMISALLRQLIIFVPVAVILPQYMGLDGVLWSAPISDLSSAVVTLIMILFVMKEINRKERMEVNTK